MRRRGGATARAAARLRPGQQGDDQRDWLLHVLTLSDELRHRNHILRCGPKADFTEQLD